MEARQLSHHAKTVFGPWGMTYAARPIARGEVLETAPVIPLTPPGNNLDIHMFPSRGYQMLHPFDDGIAAVMGAFTGYGLSELSNVSVDEDRENRTLVIAATRSIAAGEHILRRNPLLGCPDRTAPLRRLRLSGQIQPNPIEVRPGRYGLGVFAAADIVTGQYLEESPVLPIQAPDREACYSTELADYVFSWGEPDGEDRIPAHAKGLGYTGMYNHSYQPNVAYLHRYHRGDLEYPYSYDGTEEMLLRSVFLRIFALRDIAAGEELFHDYGWKPEDIRFRR